MAKTTRSEARQATASPHFPEPDPRKTECPSRKLITVLGSKWVLLVIPLLREGPRRNGDLLRSIEGVSQRMLTKTLRDLEEYQLVERCDFGESPPKVEYALTALGESLATALATFDAWVRDNAYVATNGDTFPGP